MSGHSKCSQIKRKKGIQDADQGKLFSKLSRAITIVQAHYRSLSLIPITHDNAHSLLHVIKDLEELDEVDDVYVNADILSEFISLSTF